MTEIEKGCQRDVDFFYQCAQEYIQPLDEKEFELI